MHRIGLPTLRFCPLNALAPALDRLMIVTIRETVVAVSGSTKV